MSTISKRPDAWRFVCSRCDQRGEWRDRKWWAAADLAAHEVDAHGGAQGRGVEP